MATPRAGAAGGGLGCHIVKPAAPIQSKLYALWREILPSDYNDVQCDCSSVDIRFSPCRLTYVVIKAVCAKNIACEIVVSGHRGRTVAELDNWRIARGTGIAAGTRR